MVPLCFAQAASVGALASDGRLIPCATLCQIALQARPRIDGRWSYSGGQSSSKVPANSLSLAIGTNDVDGEPFSMAASG